MFSVMPKADRLIGRRLIKAGFLVVIFVFLGRSQDPGCGSSPCRPNPVPCAHCTGNWTDDGGAVWSVSSNNTPSSIGTYSVSGSVRVPHPVFGCSGITYTVSGSITQTFGSATSRGTTSLSWNASSPSPSTVCGGYNPVSSMTYSGNILNDGCDMGNGTWSASNGGSGSFSMTKPTDLPDQFPAETTVFRAWWPLAPTIALFQGTIGSSKYMAGRQVFDSAAGGNSDNCFFPDAALDGYSPFALTGGGWFVGFYFFNNIWNDDYVGFLPSTVNYYRSKMRPPCSASAGQNMRLYARDTLSSQQYFTNTLLIELPDFSNVKVTRAGVTATTPWP